MKKKISALKWDLKRLRTSADLRSVRRFVARACEPYSYFIFNHLAATALLRNGFRTQKIGIGDSHPNSDRYYLFTYNWKYFYDGNEKVKDPNFWLRVRERRYSDYSLTFEPDKYPVGYPHLTLEAGVDKTSKALIEREQVDHHNRKRIDYRDAVRYSNEMGAVLIQPGYSVSYDTIAPLFRPLYLDEPKNHWEVRKLVDAIWTVNFLSRYVAKIFEKK